MLFGSENVSCSFVLENESHKHDEKSANFRIIHINKVHENTLWCLVICVVIYFLICVHIYTKCKFSLYIFIVPLIFIDLFYYI